MSLSISRLTEGTATSPNAGDPSLRLVDGLNPHCVVCGHENPHGLQLTFRLAADCVIADWIPTVNSESFQGVIHGGVISTVLDEAMSKAVIAQGLRAFTVDLRVRFKQKLHTGEAVQIRGWVVQQQKRRITAEASVCNSAGKEHAHAWGIFLMKLELPLQTPHGSTAGRATRLLVNSFSK